jgi:hypothetical protein
MANTEDKVKVSTNNLDTEGEMVQTLEMTVAQATEMVAQAIEKHGSPTWVAFVPTRIRRMVPANIKAELIKGAKASEGWGRQRDGRDTIIAWAKNNVFAEVTVKELAEIGEVSEATVRTLVKERMDIFKKIEGRKYEIRDPEQDRENDRRRA